MAGYSSLKFKTVKEKFDLTERRTALFKTLPEVLPSDLLLKTLERNRRVVPMNNEKSRAEAIVAPIMFEVADNHIEQISLLSGENLDIDGSQNLTGECDYILSLVPESSTIDVPILCMVECENDNINTGLGQCVAQMIGAKIFNERREKAIESIYGCVTTGYEWLFLRLDGKTIVRNEDIYLLDNLKAIMATFSAIVTQTSK